MSKFLNDDVRKMLTDILNDMVDDVYVKLYVDTLNVIHVLRHINY